MTPELFKAYLDEMRAANVMTCRLVIHGEAEMSVTLGPSMPYDAQDAAPVPGGWKSEVSDPEDPDPLQLGMLDAPLAFDDDEVQP